jgi:hypothetical protein
VVDYLKDNVKKFNEDPANEKVPDVTVAEEAKLAELSSKLNDLRKQAVKAAHYLEFVTSDTVRAAKAQAAEAITDPDAEQADACMYDIDEVNPYFSPVQKRISAMIEERKARGVAAINDAIAFVDAKLGMLPKV